MKSRLINILMLNTFLFASGGYDHGSSAGKCIWDISVTINPFNYFEFGQSYMILGYGLTDKLDFQCYYSYSHKGSDNYYGGLLYQFYKSKHLDLSTALGVRKYVKKRTTHLFAPQLLYIYKMNNKISLGGSFVNLNEINTGKTKIIDIAKDIFFMFEIFENKKYKFEITVGVFNPVMWKPKTSDWYPTYSLDIKIK